MVDSVCAAGVAILYDVHVLDSYMAIVTRYVTPIEHRLLYTPITFNYPRPRPYIALPPSDQPGPLYNITLSIERTACIREILVSQYVFSLHSVLLIIFIALLKN